MSGRQSRFGDRQSWALETRLPHLFKEIEERIIELCARDEAERVNEEREAEAARTQLRSKSGNGTSSWDKPTSVYLRSIERLAPGVKPRLGTLRPPWMNTATRSRPATQQPWHPPNGSAGCVHTPSESIR